MNLETISLFEFDPRIGFNKVAQYPSNPDTDEGLKLIIQELFLCENIPELSSDSTFANEDSIIVTHRETIESEQYLRNSFSFTVILQLNPHITYFSVDAYKRAIHGISRRLRIAEEEIQFLSLPANKRRRLEELLSRIYDQVYHQGSCSTSIDESIGLFMNLKLEEVKRNVDIITICDESIFQIKSDVFVKPLHWRVTNDLTLSRVFYLIDGRKTLLELSNDAQVNLELARLAIAELV